MITFAVATFLFLATVSRTSPLVFSSLRSSNCVIVVLVAAQSSLSLYFLARAFRRASRLLLHPCLVSLDLMSPSLLVRKLILYTRELVFILTQAINEDQTWLVRSRRIQCVRNVGGSRVGSVIWREV
jgi:hypothetical protein